MLRAQRRLGLRADKRGQVLGQYKQIHSVLQIMMIVRV